MKLVKPAEFHGDITRKATLADLKAALAEHGMVAVPHKAICWMKMNATPEVNEAFNEMIKAAEGEK